MSKNRIIFGVTFVCSIILFLCCTVYPAVFGLKPVVVKTWAMRGTMGRFSIAYVDKFEDQNIGSIVAIKTSTSESISRIVNIDGEDVTVLGDNEDCNAEKTVNVTDVEGVVRNCIPFIGILGSTTSIIIPALVICIVTSIGIYTGRFKSMGEE